MNNGSPPHTDKEELCHFDLWIRQHWAVCAFTALGDSEVCHLRGHVPPVLIVQVPVDLANEHAAVSVADPFRDGQEVHAAHDAHTAKVVVERV